MLKGFKKNKVTLLITSIVAVLLVLVTYSSYAQSGCPSSYNTLSDFNTENKLCAPRNVTWTISFRDVPLSVVPASANVQIRYVWKGSVTNGVIRTENTTRTGLTAVDADYTGSHTYTYGTGGDTCTYAPKAYLVVNGVVCMSSEKSETITVYDTDNRKGGNLRVNPLRYTVCPGGSVNVTFQDNTRFNCVPPNEIDNPNVFQRWISFDYGINSTDANFLPGVQVNLIAPPASYPVTGLTPVNYPTFPANSLGPTPAATPAITVTVPATATVGQRFVVRMNNWNICNPYPGNAPIQTEAEIVVVGAPTVSFITASSSTSNTLKTSFCQGRGIYLRNTGSYPYAAQYRYTFYNGNTVASGVAHSTAFTSSTNASYTYGGAIATGEKLVKMEVRNMDAQGTCIGEATRLITIYPTPTPDFDFYNDAGFTSLANLQQCLAALPGNTFYVRNTTTNEVNNATNPGTPAVWTRYTWTLTGPSASGIWRYNATNAGEIYNNPPVFNFTAAGTYTLRLEATNPASNCAAVLEKTIEIHPNPTAKAIIQNLTPLCTGQDVIFGDQSSVTNTFVNDSITVRRWWYEHPSATPNVTFNNGQPTHLYTYTAAGNYLVRLQVETEFGCIDEIDNPVVADILQSPHASVSGNATICAGQGVSFTNNSVNAGSPTYTLVLYDQSGALRDEQPYVNSTTEMFAAWLKPSKLNNDSIYTVRLRASLNACQALSAPVTITVRPSPNIDVVAYYNNAPFDNAAIHCLADINDNGIRFQPVHPGLPSSAIVSYTWKLKNVTDPLNPVDVTLSNNTTFPAGLFPPPFPNNASLSYSSFTTGGINDTYRAIVTVNDNINSCTITDSTTIKIYPNPSSVFVLAPPAGDCDNATRVASAESKGLFYTWSVTSPPVPTSVGYNLGRDEMTLVYPRPSGTDEQITIQLTTENQVGCKSTVTSSIVTLPKKVELSPVLALVTNNSCQPYAAVFRNDTDLSSLPANTTVNFQLKLTDGLVTTEYIPFAEDANREFHYNLPYRGTWYVSLVATTSGTDGCTGKSDSIRVDLSPPVVAAFYTPDKICAPLAFAAAESYFQAGLNRRWTVEYEDASGNWVADPNNPVASFDNIMSPMFNPFQNPDMTDRDYRITMRVTSQSTGCSHDSTRYVIVHPQPHAGFTIVNPTKDADKFCAPWRVNLRNDAVNLNAANTKYTWDFDDGGTMITDHTQANLVYTYLAPATQDSKTIEVRVETPDHCTATIAKQVKIYPKPLADFVTAPNGCSPYQFAPNVNFNNYSQNSYWYYKETTSSSWVGFSTQRDPYPDATNLFVNQMLSPYKEFDIKLIVVDIDDVCRDSIRTTIKVLPAIQAAFSIVAGSTSGCSPLDVTFRNDNFVTGTHYTWQWSDGENEVYQTTADPPTVSHTFFNLGRPQPKPYKVTLDATNVSSQCTTSASDFVFVAPEITIQATPFVTGVCAPVDVAFDNRTTGVTDHSWFYRLQGTSQQEGQDIIKDYVTTLNNFTSSTLNYEVVYTASNNFPATGLCARTQVFPFSVHPNVDASFTATPIIMTMPDDYVNVTRDPSLPVGSDITYLWEYGDETSESVVDPGGHRYAYDGHYRIKLTVASGGGACVAEDYKDIVINPILPVVDFAYAPDEGCPALEVKFTNLSKYVDSTRFKYLWDFGDGEFSDNVSPIHTYDNPGVYTVSLTAKNSIGFPVTNKKEMIIEVFPVPEARFASRPPIVYLPGGALHFDNQSYGGIDFLWNFGDGSTSTEENPVHSYEKPGDYNIKLEVTNEYGCTDEINKENAGIVRSGGNIVIPNAFIPNPNGGGESGGGSTNTDNTVFKPYIEGAVEYSLQIFNRWGELLFESYNQGLGWNGYYKGRLCKPDVYVYKIDVKFISGERTTRVGDVTLIR